ncbi:hypothetical protein [Geobacter sulfurreducens]|uniref:hypothetical protein n=1 Tax=Geobacter sulfurreducens TaxID=35554 RepID=UPI0020B823B1|nr:hypothetical protein [Geobacter sulfurreducens]UTG93453.1 hypothetical protein J8622_03735 [Geobacter sulfurreducens]
MSKMSKLWYEARDAIQSGTYIKTRTCILQEYLAELSIVQPWESDPQCVGAVDMKIGMKNKLKEEIERRKQKFWANFRMGLWTLLAGVIAGIIVVTFEHVAFPGKNQPNKETAKTAPPQLQESIANPNLQNTQAIDKQGQKAK